MLANSEEFYQSLQLPYHVVAIVSGALNNAAAAKYDLEAWFPFQGEYKELVSCSNCTDYQSRRLDVRCGFKKPGDTKQTFVHMLNGTLCATERALCCVVENWQTPEGLKIPPVLQPYMQVGISCRTLGSCLRTRLARSRRSKSASPTGTFRQSFLLVAFRLTLQYYHFVLNDPTLRSRSNTATV